MEEQKFNMQGFEQASDAVKMSILGKQQVLNQNLINLKMSKKGEYLKISLETPEGQLRISHDVMVIIDISGSMAAEAQVKGQQGLKESHGLSYLDILKHAVKTIMLNLNEKDRFSLVSYSDEARLEYKLDFMTKDNKQLAMVAIDNLQDEGSTNTWAGLQEGLDQLKENYIEGQHQSILLLTDGDPNIFPPSGFIPQLQKYKKRYQNFRPTLNTFAIGKHIDSNLLDQLALEGNGAYYFIPCPGFVGTIFVNAISNILSTMASNCELTIETLNGAKIQQIFGFPVQNKNTIMCGDIRFGQVKDILLKIQVPDDYQYIKKPILNISLKYYDYFTKQYRIGQLKDQELPDYDDLFVETAYCRLTFVENIRQVLKEFSTGNEEKARQILIEMAKQFNQIQQKQVAEMNEYDGDNKEYLQFKFNTSQNFIENILKDIEGEVTLAIKSKESFNHWGKHYLPSLNHCHLRQQCNNFIDPGIQSYATNFFNEIKDLAEETFLKMPAPKPSVKKNIQNQQYQQQQYQYQQQNQPRQNQQQQQQQNQGQQKQRSRTPSPQQKQSNDNNSGGGVDMAYYYNAAGGCFEGNCTVNMADGSLKKVTEIQKGDQVKGVGDTIHTVKLVIKITCINNKQCLVKLGNGLLITPKHPIYINGQWMKPFQVETPQIYDCSEVYNFVLSSGHVIQVNGILCVTFGHGLKDKNVEHSYFGSQKIVNDLMKLSKKGKNNEKVILNMQQFLRNENNKVYGLLLDSQ